MKRVVSCLVLLSLLFSLVGIAYAEETADGFQYRVEKDGSVSITGYSGDGGELLIPSEIAGKAVTKILRGAFYQNEQITSVLVPEGIISIGEGAFGHCQEIKSIQLPSTLRTIEKGAFQHCRNLQNINIPEGITDIPENALSGIFGMEEITLPSTLKTIGRGGLYYTGFHIINLPDGLEKIGMSAFQSSALKSMVIPNSVKSIGSYAFFDCRDQLTSVVLPTGLTRIEDGMFNHSWELEKVAIHKNVTRIGSEVFDFSDKVSIWGFQGSAAETYAKKNDIPFVTVEMTKEVKLFLNDEDITKGSYFIDLNTDTMSIDLAAQTYPENPWPGVIWKSSDGKTVSVDADGHVTGLKKGKATITATAVDGSGKKATCEITVANLAKEINITGENTVNAGKKLKLSATVLPEATSNKKIEWTTSDKNIATVEAGTITAKKVSEETTVTITAAAKDGSGVFAEFILLPNINSSIIHKEVI